MHIYGIVRFYQDTMVSFAYLLGNCNKNIRFIKFSIVFTVLFSFHRIHRGLSCMIKRRISNNLWKDLKSSFIQSKK